MSLNSVLEQFSPISLKEMDSVELMNRFDSKFIFPLLSLKISSELTSEEQWTMNKVVKNILKNLFILFSL